MKFNPVLQFKTMRHEMDVDTPAAIIAENACWT
ncbi:MAG: hypothetical protein TIS_04429 [Tissierella sp.]